MYYEALLLELQVEFILMGGTFMSLPLDYRDYFVRNLHDALSGHASSNVQEAVKFSEQSRTRCIGLTIETRPDYCLTPHLTQVGTCLTTHMPSAGCRKLACLALLSLLCVRAAQAGCILTGGVAQTANFVVHSSAVHIAPLRRLVHVI